MTNQYPTTSVKFESSVLLGVLKYLLQDERPAFAPYTPATKKRCDAQRAFLDFGGNIYHI